MQACGFAGPRWRYLYRWPQPLESRRVHRREQHGRRTQPIAQNFTHAILTLCGVRADMSAQARLLLTPSRPGSHSWVVALPISEADGPRWGTSPSSARPLLTTLLPCVTATAPTFASDSASPHYHLEPPLDATSPTTSILAPRCVRHVLHRDTLLEAAGCTSTKAIYGSSTRRSLIITPVTTGKSLAATSRAHADISPRRAQNGCVWRVCNQASAHHSTARVQRARCPPTLA